MKGRGTFAPAFLPAMPVYVIEFVTSDARPHQRRFTLDDDRALRPQLEHVLAELERAGLVLRGGPTDGLTVRWAGREVDGARSPTALGVTPDRPIELRMQRRRAPVTLTAPPPPPEAPPQRFIPRAVYAGSALGAAGAWAAWTLAGAFSDGSADGGGALVTHAGLDGVAAALFGLLVGGVVGVGHARRDGGSAAGGAAAGAAGGIAASIVWAAVGALVLDRGDGDAAGMPSPAAAVVWRAASWALLGACVAAGGSLGTSRWSASGGRLFGALRAAGWASLAGLVGGLVPALPGPVELYGALGAALAGAGVGAAAAWAAMREAIGVLSLEAVGARGPGVLSLREWNLGEGRAVALAGAAGEDGPLVAVANRVVTQASAAGVAPRPVRQDDRVAAGGARYRFRRLVASVLAAGAVGAAAQRAAQAQTPAQIPAQASAQTGGDAARDFDRVTLVRCIAERPLPCVNVRVTLPPSAAVRDAFATGGADAADAPDTAAALARAAGWSGRLGPYTLEPVRVQIARAGGARRVVLTLIDVSGSMRGDGMQVARAAVRAFLRDLGAGAGPGDVQAGLGAFASRNVVAGIQRVAFTAPETAAGGVDLLPPAAGNTGLYSAVAAGAERVAAAAREAGEGTRAALVVITDGVNDVADASGRPRRDDDPGLLRGPDGRSAAAGTARRLGVDLYLVGVGQEPDMNELQALAGDGGRAFRTARDAVALRQALTRVDAALAPTRDVLFAVTGAERASLARPEWRLVVAQGGGADGGLAGGPSPGSARAAFVGMWPAPLVGTPVFRGTAFRADGRGPAAPAWLRAAAGEGMFFERRGLVSLFVALLVAIVWALPRALWQPVPWAPAGAPAVGATPARALAGAGGVGPTDTTLRQLPLRPVPQPAGGAAAALGAAGDGLAPDVREAPPRRPEDVTAQRVRHHGTRPASRTGAAQPAAPRRP